MLRWKRLRDNTAKQVPPKQNNIGTVLFKSALRCGSPLWEHTHVVCVSEIAKFDMSISKSNPRDYWNKIARQVSWLVPLADCLPDRFRSVTLVSCPLGWYGTYSSGSVQASHLIPFWSLRDVKPFANQCNCKFTKFNSYLRHKLGIFS